MAQRRPRSEAHRRCLVRYVTTPAPGCGRSVAKQMESTQPISSIRRLRRDTCCCTVESIPSQKRTSTVLELDPHPALVAKLVAVGECLVVDGRIEHKIRVDL
jgi:hypothetical protein